MAEEFIIEMLNITKVFPGIKANDNVTLQLKKVRFMLCWVRMARASPPL